MANLKITSEEDAFDLLEKLLDGLELEEGVQIENIEFEGWPRFVIRIEGRDFDGTIPTRIMPALLELQTGINRVYCNLVYNDSNLRRLTKQDKEELELLVRVGRGSSSFESLLVETLVKLSKELVGKMTSEHILIILLVAGVLWTARSMWKD